MTRVRVTKRRYWRGGVLTPGQLLDLTPEAAAVLCGPDGNGDICGELVEEGRETMMAEQRETAIEPAAKRGRGRPPGSKNKAKK